MPPTGLIPWFLTEGNTLSTVMHRPFLFKGKTNASSRSSGKNLCRRCRGGSTSSLPSTHHKLSSLALHYLTFSSHFSLPTSKWFRKNTKTFALFIHPSFVRLFICLCARLFGLPRCPKKIPSCVTFPTLIIVILLVLRLLPPLVQNLMN